MSLNIQNTTYAGEHAGRYINAAFLTSRTLMMDGVKKMMNIKFKSVIQNLNAANVIDDSACGYTDGFALATNEIVLEPKELQTTLTLCKQEFHDDWQAKYQFMSANDNVPPKFQDYLLGYIGGLIGSEVEQHLWTGGTATAGTAGAAGTLTEVAGEFIGFLTRIRAYRNQNATIGSLPAAQDITGINTAAAIASGQFSSTTSSTVKAAFTDLINAIPEPVYSKSPQSLMIYSGLNPIKALVDSYGSQDNGINNQQQTWWSGGFSGLRINGLPIFVATGISGAGNGGDLVATYKDNLIFGTGLMRDMNEATVIDLAKIDGSRNVRIIYRFTCGTIIGNPSDITYRAQGTAKS